MGKPILPIIREDIPSLMGSKRGELKHLSTFRKRKQFSDFPSSGERTGTSPNLSATADRGYRARIIKNRKDEADWKAAPQKVIGL